MIQIKASVIPRAKVDRVLQLSETEYKIWTTAPAVNDKANEAVIELLAKFLQIRKSKIYLVSGNKNRHKVFQILE